MEKTSNIYDIEKSDEIWGKKTLTGLWQTCNIISLISVELYRTCTDNNLIQASVGEYVSQIINAEI